jgi:hypothetical protein
MFDKVKKLKPYPVMPPAGKDIVNAWESVREQFIDEKRHEKFIQLCLLRDNLPFASSQYKAVLDSDPMNDIAQKMQNRIIQLAAVTYLESKTRETSAGGWSLAHWAIIVGSTMVAVGVIFPYARSLVALGTSLCVFVIALRKLA